MEQEIKFNSKPGKPDKRKKNNYFQPFIVKILKKLSDNNLTLNAKQQLDSAIKIMLKRICTTSVQLLTLSEKKTISEKEICNVIQILCNFSSEYQSFLCDYAKERMEQFLENKTRYTSRQTKAGINIPPSLIEKFLRGFGIYNILITANSSVYLAAIIERITTQILQEAIKVSEKNEHVRITIRDIELCVRCDKNLSELFRKMNINFIGGGVIPYIHRLLLVKKPRKRKTSEKKNYRFRPGTVAIRDIRKMQKTSNCLIFSKEPFERLIRENVQLYKEDMKIGRSVPVIIQYYIEQFITNFLNDVGLAAIHRNHTKVTKEDIFFICKLRGLVLGDEWGKTEVGEEEEEEVEEESEKKIKF